MADVFDRLKAALSDRYAVEREITVTVGTSIAPSQVRMAIIVVSRRPSER